MFGNDLGKACLVLGLVFGAAGAAGAQDLFDRAGSGGSRDRGGSAGSRTYTGRDRLDLVAGARIPSYALGDRGSGTLALGGEIESDFACGKFDLKANLKSLLSKEAGEDFLNALLGAVESELAYNALMLLAETSPTAFQLFQHWRVNANALLGIQYDRCQAIETAINDGMKSIQAKAIKDCVEEKRLLGYGMEDAMKACENSDEIRSLSGEKVKELDLTVELKKLFKISDVDFANLEKLLSKIRITRSGASGEIKADAVLEEYDRLEKDYYRAWLDVTDALAADPKAKVPDEKLAKLGPSWAPRPLPVELGEIAKIPAPHRRILLEGVARQAAFLELTVQVQKLERWLEAEAQHPKMDEASVKRRELEVRALRRQIAHIAELVRRQDEYNASLLALSGAGQSHQSKLASEGLYRALDLEGTSRYFDAAPKWGAVTTRPRAETSGRSSGTTTVEGKGCSTCGFGDVNKEKK